LAWIGALTKTQAGSQPLYRLTEEFALKPFGLDLGLIHGTKLPCRAYILSTVAHLKAAGLAADGSATAAKPLTGFR
jgi:hypothetical protein